MTLAGGHVDKRVPIFLVGGRYARLASSMFLSPGGGASADPQLRYSSGGMAGGSPVGLGIWLLGLGGFVLLVTGAVERLGPRRRAQ